jgi:predicted RNA methylase
LCQERLGIHIKNYSPTRLRIRRSEARFDATFGVETGGIIPSAKLEAASPSKEHSSPYEASNPYVFAAALKSLNISFSDYTFVDVGSGKGRVLLMALAYGFKRIVGVEFARQLHEAAVKNIERYKATAPHTAEVECLCEDVIRWQPRRLRTWCSTSSTPLGHRSWRHSWRICGNR